MELDYRAILLEKGLIKKRSLKEVNKALNARLKEIKWVILNSFLPINLRMNLLILQFITKHSKKD